MKVKIYIEPTTKEALKIILSNISSLMTNLSGSFDCEIEISANFKK